MEGRLVNLIEGNSETNRLKRALQWKSQGKPVIGVLCSYVPEEVIYAAGMMPWRVTGTWQANVSKALVYRPKRSTLYHTHVLESLLSGEYDFLDGVVATDSEQELVRLWDVWSSLRKTPFTHIMHIPHHNSQLAHEQFEIEIGKFVGAIEKYGEVVITDQDLSDAIAVFNKMRSLLTRLYELRKRDVPPLTGAEILGVVTAATVSQRNEFNCELESVLPYIERRRVNLPKVHPRVLVSSDTLDNPAYLALVEEAGCLVAMDDIDPGSRYFWGEVDVGPRRALVPALARRYINRPASARMANWPEQASRITTWVRNFNIDGVLELPEVFSYQSTFRSPFLASSLKKSGIPCASFKRDYHLGNAEQLRTRIQAFVEMLER